MNDETPARGDGALVRALGVIALAAGIVNVTIGGGIFRLPSAAATALGAAAPLAYLVCGVAMIFVVICFAEAGSRVSLTGGVYAYVERAFGPLPGFLTGVFLYVGLTAALAAVSTFLADSVSALVPALGAPLPRAIGIVVVLLALGWLNVRGVRGAGRFNALTTAAKLVPLMVLVVVGAFAVKGENLRMGTAPAPGDLARASAVLIFAFLGVEAALVPSGEVRDPSRTVPRAVFAAIAVVTVVYLAVQLVVQGILGAALADQKTPLAEAAAVALGPWGRTLILVGSSVSMFGYVSGMTLAVPRMLYAFARDGFLPSGIAAVHSRYRTPYVAIAIQVVLTAVLSITGTFETLAIVANGAVLLAYVACCGAALELRRRDVRAGGTPFAVPLPGVAPVIALAIIVWLLTSLKPQEWAALGVVAVLALIAYTFARAAGGGMRRATADASSER